MPTDTRLFYDRFADNMKLLGLKAPPRSLFETATVATATTAALARAVNQYGTKVTVREVLLTIPALASAAGVAELAALAGTVLLVVYVGACIGSLIVAAGQSPTLPNYQATASRLGVGPAPWLIPTFSRMADARRGRP